MPTLWNSTLGRRINSSEGVKRYTIVPVTMADIEKSRKILGYSPKVDVDTGVSNFVKWYRSYYQV